ncbi:glycosyltransferase family 4 protein [Candidatus Gottesmanbacteria bacterium]|nr:glycosyltransferase family 4 protein [Candidatus Gottesmanbacteria bacterium]
MIIGIDGNEANQKIRVGSGIYAFELLKQFKEFRIQNLEFRIYLKDEPIKDLPKESSKWKYIIIGPKSLWTQLGLPIKLWREKMLGIVPDVFFTPSHYAPRFCPIPSVVTIFDLSFIRFPEMFLPKDLYQLKNWTAYSIRQAKKIITISENSKSDIIKYYGISEERIVVAYPGYDRQKFKIQPPAGGSKFKINTVKKKYKINSLYILCVGTIQPRKNLIRLLEAFAMLKYQVRKAKPIQERIKLVICGMIKEGRGGWMQENFKFQISNFKLENDVIVTSYVPEDDLPYLMAGAKTLILPSLYEGFGIPAIEAMACGVPVVVSNVSSLPEIVGDAGILVDPYDVESIMNGLKEACYNNSRREELIDRGLDQVKKFSWESSAAKILKVLNLSSRA